MSENTCGHFEKGRLHEALEWFQVTLRSIGDAVIATDASGLISFMNPVAEKLTGYSFEAARGRPLVECFHGLRHVALLWSINDRFNSQNCLLTGKYSQ